MIRRESLVLCMLLVVFDFGGRPVFSQPPKESVGTKVGSIITDALNAAVPGVGTLVKLFRPEAKDTDAKAKETVTNARQQLVSDVVRKLKPLSDLSAELDAVTRFLAASVPAANRCARFTGALDSPQTPVATRTSLWTECQTELKTVYAVPDTVVNAVTDEGLRLRLMEIRSICRDADSEIQRAITAGDWADARSQIRGVSQSLNAVLAVSAIEVARFKTTSDGLVQWANNPAGPALTVRNTDMFLKESQTALDQARPLVKKTGK